MCIMKPLRITPEQIEIARRLLRSTQQNVADQVLLERGNYIRIEKGQSDPKISTFYKIISFFNAQGISFYDNGNVSKVRDDSAIPIFEITPEQIETARSLLRCTQRDIADAVEIRYTNYAKIERGESDPKISTFFRIVDFFEDRGIVFHSDGRVTKDPAFSLSNG